MGMYPMQVQDGKKLRDMTDAEVRAATGIDCSGDEVLTKQEFKDDADINVIMARCLRDGGIVNYVNRVAPVFADVSDVPDFQGCVQRVKDAESAFMLLPANVRSRFNNDPVALVQFLGDPGNRSEAEKLGLIVVKRVQDPKTGVWSEVPKDPPVVPASPAVAPGS